MKQSLPEDKEKSLVITSKIELPTDVLDDDLIYDGFEYLSGKAFSHVSS